MSARKLGRGLDALITQAPESQEHKVLQIEASKIKTNPSQPRKRFSLNELEELKTSISREGILQPILVRESGGQYEVVAGERRLRAAKDLGMHAVPAVVLEISDARMMEIALIENIHRENLNPIELSQAFQQLIKLKSWTQEALAENLGLSRSGVTNTLRLLELPEDMQNAISRNQISMGHAKVLLSVSDPKEQRLLFERIAEDRLSVRDLEEARSDNVLPEPGKGGGRKRSSQKSPHIISLEEELTRALGTRVRIRQGKGRGSISIEFYSSEDFDRIRKFLYGGGIALKNNS